MSRRHLAALTLLGWYLMMPPWKPKLDSNAPLSRWVPFKAFFEGIRLGDGHLSLSNDDFRNSADCQESLARLKEVVKNRPQSNYNNDPRFNPSEKDFAVMVAHAICIEDSDPRLKGNIRYTGK